MQESEYLQNIERVAQQFADDRHDRQRRRRLDPEDFARLVKAGHHLVALPVDQGGLWRDVARSTRLICQGLRTLAKGDASVALVSAMHPAVLSYWLSSTEAFENADFQDQLAAIFESVRQGRWWGTITSEPGSGGDVNKTRTLAMLADSPLRYTLHGQKHFGSGSGVTSFMVTSARPEGEEDPDWFFLDVSGVPWDGSQGVTLTGEWDGHGMAATQSHSFSFEGFPATRIAWTGRLADISKRVGPFIGCLFTSVIVGIVEAACATASEALAGKSVGAYEEVEWTHARTETWLIQQAMEAMVTAVETKPDPRRDVLQGKLAIATLSEQMLTRLCRIMGGGSYARHSPFGFWFEDVRALGFLRPPWGLTFQTLTELNQSRPVTEQS